MASLSNSIGNNIGLTASNQGGSIYTRETGKSCNSAPTSTHTVKHLHLKYQIYIPKKKKIYNSCQHFYIQMWMNRNSGGGEPSTGGPRWAKLTSKATRVKVGSMLPKEAARPSTPYTELERWEVGPQNRPEGFGVGPTGLYFFLSIKLEPKLPWTMRIPGLRGSRWPLVVMKILTTAFQPPDINLKPSP